MANKVTGQVISKCPRRKQSRCKRHGIIDGPCEWLVIGRFCPLDEALRERRQTREHCVATSRAGDRIGDNQVTVFQAQGVALEMHGPQETGWCIRYGVGCSPMGG